MAENTIEIEVELKGEKDTLKGIDQIKEGAEGIGESFKGVGELVSKTNQQMGESLNAVSDAVGSSVTAFSEMGSAIKSVSTGGAGITALLGPIGLLTTAVAAGVEAFRQFSGAAAEAEARQAAFGAAAGDLQSKLEALAERGFVPAREELLKYARANLEAQIQKELLQFRVEKANKVLQAEAEALQRQTEARAALSKAEAQAIKDGRLIPVLTRAKIQAEQDYVAAQKATTEAFSGIANEQARVNKLIEGTAQTYKDFEEQSKENLETKAKELIAQRATIQALEIEARVTGDAAKLTAARNVERAKTADLLRLEKMGREDLASFVKAQEVAIKALNEEALKDTILSKKIAELNAKKAESRSKDTSAAKAQAAALKAIQAERLALVQESQIRQLDIKLTKEGDAELLALARERYETGLKLAQDDAMKRAIVLKQYQLETQTIMDQAEARELDRLKRQDEASRKMQAEAAAGRKKQMEDEVKAQIEMVANFQNFTKELTKSTASEVNAAAATLGQIIDEYGKGFARATAEAILFGDVSGKTFKQATGEILKSLAIEATVQSLMKGAQALAMLFVNPVEAGNLAASAAAYGAAAAAARAGAGALGVGGGGTAAGGGTTASPSGAPQVAGAPQRERAETRETVVNINFGGAVIYDSQEAARRAMMNELVRTYNSAPRGSARFNMGR